MPFHICGLRCCCSRNPQPCQTSLFFRGRFAGGLAESRLLPFESGFLCSFGGVFSIRRNTASRRSSWLLGVSAMDLNDAIYFDTFQTATLLPKGNGTDGAVQIFFFTPDQKIYSTIFGPRLALQLRGELSRSLKIAPTHDFPDPIVRAHDVPGTEATDDVVTYFEQKYPKKVLCALEHFPIM